MIKKNRCYIVAEIGINHNGQVENAKQLILDKITKELC